MKVRSLVLFGTSGILGLVAIMLVKIFIQPPPAAASATKVVVAATTLRFGDTIRAGDLQLVEFAPGSVPEGAFHSIDELTNSEPRYALETIHSSEAVTGAKITGKGGKASLSSVIDQTKRAVTIRVNDVFGVAGFVTPADHVDVMLTHGDDPQRPNENPKTEVLLQNVKVLGIDQEANEREGKPAVAKAVTLEVSPEEAQKLALGSAVGTLSLALRNFTDPLALNTRVVSVADLGAATVKTPGKLARAPSAHVPTIAVIRGTETTSYALHGDRAEVLDKKGK